MALPTGVNDKIVSMINTAWDDWQADNLSLKSSEYIHQVQSVVFNGKVYLYYIQVCPDYPSLSFNIKKLP